MTVENQGIYTENFPVTVYGNVTDTQTRIITLASGDSTNVTFTWNTTDSPKGNYSLRAEVWPLTGETDITDNTFVDDWGFVSIPGDVNGDKKSGFERRVRHCQSLRLIIGDPKYSPNPGHYL